MSKQTRLIKRGEILSGYCELNGDIYINIQLLHTESRKQAETLFINTFAQTIQHETIHREINKYLKDPKGKYFYGEEVIVRKLTGEKFNKADRKYYRDNNDNKNRRRLALGTSN